MAFKNYFNQLGKGSHGDDVFKDMGFGYKPFDQDERLINEDGSFNVSREVSGWLRPYDAYYALISMSWVKFLFLVLITYLLINLIFAGLYLLIGFEELSVKGRTDLLENLSEAFFFSSQTITTVGYGRVNPVGFWGGVVSSLESLMGLMGFALITGLLYGRFSKPRARIRYSKQAIVAPYQEMNAIMFRLANQRRSELIEVEVKMVYTYYDHGQKKRVFENLKLEREKVNFLPLSWTVVHPIIESSPFHGQSESSFKAQKGEFLILIKAFDDSFSQTVYARQSYRYDEVEWGSKFVGAFGSDSKGRVALYLNSLDNTEEVLLN